MHCTGLGRGRSWYTVAMEPKRAPRRFSLLTAALLAAPVTLVAPFLLLGIALLDDHVLHTHVPHKLYNALGIWDAVEGLYFILVS